MKCAFLSTGVVAGGGDGIIGSDSPDTSTGMSHDSSYHTVYAYCGGNIYLGLSKPYFMLCLSSCDTGATESSESEEFGMSISFSCAQILSLRYE